MRICSGLMGLALAGAVLAPAFGQIANPGRIGSQASAGDTTVPGAVASAAVASGGTGYGVGDTITIGGGSCSVSPVVTVATVSAGAVASITLTTPGSCTGLPANPAPQSATSGSGSGATLGLVWVARPVTLFGGAVPANGWKVANPDPVSDLWANDNGAAAIGQGVRVFANGGQYATEAGERPFGAVSVYGPVIGQKISARRW